ncbi:MAG: bifunctional phosphoribosylaminoimidazolecarboxamide formyltransferase/IMP cyclohydrolase [Phycisphaerae bacterium]|nr:bifunctional phosphoribosylaminoimidazolecarboxamide formyltransferase/IMP cyclohydrolase [Phycisphaerae bacterium]
MTHSDAKNEAEVGGPHLVRIRRALISVSDKAGVVDLAKALHAIGCEIVSTGGTASALAKSGVPVTPIEALTGFPEMMDGRVKTLHPRVHGGLLGVRSNAEHRAAMAEHGIQPIDLVCVNLYPFEQTVQRDGVQEHEAIEQIDIGGPSMLRSAAKNFQSVAVLTAPDQYAELLSQITLHDGCTTLALRRALATAVFARTAAYDAAIATWLETHGSGQASLGTDHPSDQMPVFPPTLRLAYPMANELRYGENPHQRGAVYADPTWTGASVVSARLLHGKALSYNNLLDAAAALELVQDLHAQGGGPACAVIKHTNPCGAAIAGSVLQSFERAWSGDPLAAFGGIVAFSATLDAATAAAMAEGERFLEVVIAPDYEPAALERLQARWKNARLLAVGALDAARAVGAHAVGRDLALRSVPGGMLAQERDALAINASGFTHAAGPAPSAAMLRDAGMLFVVAKHLKSNAVCVGCGGTLLGAGAGQMDRVASCRNAIEKARAAATRETQRAAERPSTPLVAASDAFFPFSDGPTLLVDAGVRCIVHPGGSKRDQDTFGLCNARGVTCLLTGTRHFRH